MTDRLPLGLALTLWDRMTTWEETVEITRLAEELGYDCVMLPESFGRDGFTLFVSMPGPNRSACEPILEGIVPERLR